MKITAKAKMIINWAKSHNYPVKVTNDGRVIFLTKYQSAEYIMGIDETIWHEKEFFEKG